MLKVGRRSLRVRLFNESAGGFAAWLDRDPKLKVNDVVELLTDLGSIEARVAYIGLHDPGHGGARQESEVFRVGLERLEDRPGERKRSARCRRWLARQPQRVFASKKALVATVLVLLGAAVLGTAGVLNELDGPRVRQSLGWDEPLEVPVASGQSALADVARDLTLTAPQQEEIRRLADKAAHELAPIDAQWAQDNPAERARKRALLLDAVRREIGDLLGRRGTNGGLPSQDE